MVWQKCVNILGPNKLSSDFVSSMMKAILKYTKSLKVQGNDCLGILRGRVCWNVRKKVEDLGWVWMANVC